VYQSRSAKWSSRRGSLQLTLVLIVTMLYFSANPDLYTKGLVKLVPEPRRARIRE
jgi:hypothetical protein